MDNRPALQPREVKFSDLVPSGGKHGSATPIKGERRWFRPAPQKFTTHAAKPAKVSHADGLEGESDQDEERRRSRVRALHEAKVVKLSKAKALSKLNVQPDTQSTPIEISGNAVLVENGSFNAVCALSVLKDCVAHERQLKEELARTNVAKTQAFRTVISTYLASVTQANKPMPGRRKMTSELALAQCAVVAQTLVVTIQSYVRALESRMHVVSRFCRRQNTLERFQCTSPSTQSWQAKGGESDLEHSLSKTTASHQDLLDEGEINRLKQLYFDYYDCDVYVVPGGRPESRIPPDALLLDSLSGYGSFVLESDDADKSSFFSSSSACDKSKAEAGKEEDQPPTA
ncbi:hypothetical protein, conserved [Trypanosoma brucei gambiense DAL972]|uniref:Uncharacterized protein n=2 Tax=Trypanosoma brucei TaxID=5691 RepID=C9ZYD7_TRYB9|nr:hypothetical protein, conserved [Trypanosoma brucei gambiense DAL972]RHW70305.1 hypothetical protein DPX39_090050000 [Trypanosoma brucei equiperdum]CBH14436.1 hypothetical protein, conserved [Trypanosoma brucei gambiense DAL972]|eukprot:XP_011776702.1 hypothetical protein, conserved [Trypanosoma brucei gambiense DAL972]